MNGGAYRNFEGDWKVSVWKDGRRYYTSSEDDHTYFEDGEGGGGHDDCPCFNKTFKNFVTPKET